MKFVTAYLILTALVFLNVPRSLVHGHDHVHEHESHHSEESDLSFESDDCFVCEFQLDQAVTPTPLSFKKAPCRFAAWNAENIDDLRSSKFLLFEHRGPPAI